LLGLYQIFYDGLVIAHDDPEKMIDSNSITYEKDTTGGLSPNVIVAQEQLLYDEQSEMFGYNQSFEIFTISK
jgi:hypothetical protein